MKGESDAIVVNYAADTPIADQEQLAQTFLRGSPLLSSAAQTERIVIESNITIDTTSGNNTARNYHCMRIKVIHVQRFRSIYDATLECDELTVMVGANGSGKSTFLRALAVFYNPTADIELADFYNTATTDHILIAVTYMDLSDNEQAAFRKYVHDGHLTVEKRISWDALRQKASQSYYGFVLQHQAFVPLRDPNTQFAPKRSGYQTLRAQPKYTELPPTVVSEAALRMNLETWERAHPELCELLPSPGQFFGFKQASAARLELYTRFLLIEAQRDAHLAALDERDSPIKQLLDEVVRNVIAEHEGVKALQQQATAALKAISSQIDLSSLNAQLNTTMRQLVPNTGIYLNWQDPILSLPIPRVSLQISEDGYITSLNRTGHGVQRAFIITLLQHLAVSARQNAEVAATDTIAPPSTGDGQQGGGSPAPIGQPNLILAVEEPELYQHPTRQRHFASVLRDLSNGAVKGVANSIQVLYCTHSPYFVDLDRFEQIRVIAKVQGAQPNEPKCTGVRATRRRDITELTAAQLAVMMSSTINEGFFARLVVLVEGEGDRALLHAVAQLHHLPLEAHGIAILSVEGNGNFNKPMIVFRKLGIEVYPIWDTDSDKISQVSTAGQAIQNNRRMLALCGLPEEDWPTGVHATYAVFDPKLEHHLQMEVASAGLDWHVVEQEALSVAGTNPKWPWKKHAVVAQAVITAARKGCAFPETLKILRQVCILAGISAVLTPEASIASRVSDPIQPLDMAS